MVSIKVVEESDVEKFNGTVNRLLQSGYDLVALNHLVVGDGVRHIAVFRYSSDVSIAVPSVRMSQSG